MSASRAQVVDLDLPDLANGVLVALVLRLAQKRHVLRLGDAAHVELEEGPEVLRNLRASSGQVS